MTLSNKCVTQTLILHLKEGVNLEDVASGDNSRSDSLAVESFVRLTNLLKAQPGFIRQFWGHQVEDSHIFVWSIDWESFGSKTAFTDSEEHNSFMAGLSQVFDLEVAAPLTLYTHFGNHVVAAFEAPVTEVALYTLPTVDYTEEARTTINGLLHVPSMRAIKTIGKSPGGGSGWIVETQNAGAPEGRSIALHGVFGYPGVDDHVRWRQSPEHAKVMEEMEPAAKWDLRAANLPGGGIFVPEETGMFHVKFRTGT